MNGAMKEIKFIWLVDMTDVKSVSKRFDSYSYKFNIKYVSVEMFFVSFLWTSFAKI